MTAQSCVENSLVLGYVSVPNDNEKCEDCGVINGGFHHPGCDQELCPACYKQMIGDHNPNCELAKILFGDMPELDSIIFNSFPIQ